ncbi:hypothetical protein DFH07DRAFT_843711 [Mycena maculata]|uniref:Uncharacterized protein n=1 Tax=Mycena maculata TaxID=230809 RepID=A0AAD7I6L2_9AGAR|nr:hypothetical protein DFH07DRAFT_843711 [Mycena maculata]
MGGEHTKCVRHGLSGPIIPFSSSTRGVALGATNGHRGIQRNQHMCSGGGGGGEIRTKTMLASQTAPPRFFGPPLPRKSRPTCAHTAARFVGECPGPQPRARRRHVRRAGWGSCECRSALQFLEQGVKQGQETRRGGRAGRRKNEERRKEEREGCTLIVLVARWGTGVGGEHAVQEKGTGCPRPTLSSDPLLHRPPSLSASTSHDIPVSESSRVYSGEEDGSVIQYCHGRGRASREEIRKQEEW